MTVPGMAKESMVMNSNAGLPGEALAIEHIGGKQPERRRERRRDTGKNHRRKE